MGRREGIAALTARPGTPPWAAASHQQLAVPARRAHRGGLESGRDTPSKWPARQVHLSKRTLWPEAGAAAMGHYRTHAAQRNIDPKRSLIRWPPCNRPKAMPKTASRSDYQCTVRAGDCRRKWSRVGAGAGRVEASEFL